MTRALQITLEQMSVSDGATGSGPGEDAYDLAVVASSWDPRATAPTALDISPREVLLINYANPGTSGRSKTHEAVLRAWADEVGAVLHRAEVASEEVVVGFQMVWASLVRLARSYGRPVSVLLDLSVVPRYLSLGLLAVGVQSGVVSRVDFLYESAVYPERAAEEPEEVSIAPSYASSVADRQVDEEAGPESPALFTEGRWRTIHIPGLRGSYAASASRHYVVSLGFEGDDTYRVVTQKEPERVSAIVPDPPVYEGLVERCESENSVLLKEWVGLHNVHRCGATDAVAVAESTQECLAPDENAVLLPVGTKPHGLGMAVAALRSGQPMVLYRWPSRHREGGAGAGGARWLYRVRDRSALV